jgi:hypothetical protein
MARGLLCFQSGRVVTEGNMTRLRVSFGVSLLVAGVIVPRAVGAQPGVIVQPYTAVLPEHLQLGDQHYEASVAGFEAYLDSIKSTDPGLWGQIAPDVARLDSRERSARSALIFGVVAGVATAIYGFASTDNCVGPTLSDPNFGADSATWGACNQRNISKMATFSFLGAGIMVVGGVISYASRPGRQDLLDLVNKHNRLSKQPLQLQLGYDPAQRFAFSGAAVSF